MQPHSPSRNTPTSVTGQQCHATAFRSASCLRTFESHVRSTCSRDKFVQLAWTASNRPQVIERKLLFGHSLIFDSSPTNTNQKKNAVASPSLNYSTRSKCQSLSAPDLTTSAARYSLDQKEYVNITRGSILMDQTISVTPLFCCSMHHVMSQFVDFCLFLCMRLGLYLFVFSYAWCSPMTADIMFLLRSMKCTHTHTDHPWTDRGPFPLFLATGPISHVATFASLLPPQKGASSYSAVNEDDKLEEPLSLLLSPCHKAYCCRQST